METTSFLVRDAASARRSNSLQSASEIGNVACLSRSATSSGDKLIIDSPSPLHPVTAQAATNTAIHRTEQYTPFSFMLQSLAPRIEGEVGIA